MVWYVHIYGMYIYIYEYGMVYAYMVVCLEVIVAIVAVCKPTTCQGARILYITVYMYIYVICIYGM